MEICDFCGDDPQSIMAKVNTATFGRVRLCMVCWATIGLAESWQVSDVERNRYTEELIARVSRLLRGEE